MKNRRSQLRIPGNFVPLGAVADLDDDLDLACAMCARWCEEGFTPGWLHVPTNRVVCVHCMGDPWHRDGRVGQEMAQRLKELPRLDVEVY